MFADLIENIVCCKKTVKIGKMVKNGENHPILAKKSQKMADFCGFLDKIGVFLVLAPFPAPRNRNLFRGTRLQYE